MYNARWLSKYLCKHGIKVLNYIKMLAVDYMHYFLTQKYYLRTYAHIAIILEEPHLLRRRRNVGEFTTCTKKSVVVRYSMCK